LHDLEGGVVHAQPLQFVSHFVNIDDPRLFLVKQIESHLVHHLLLSFHLQIGKFGHIGATHYVKDQRLAHHSLSKLRILFRHDDVECHGEGEHERFLLRSFHIGGLNLARPDNRIGNATLTEHPTDNKTSSTIAPGAMHEHVLALMQQARDIQDVGDHLRVVGQVEVHDGAIDEQEAFVFALPMAFDVTMARKNPQFAEAVVCETLVLHVMCGTDMARLPTLVMTTEQQSVYKVTFDLFDKNKAGVIDVHEVRHELKRLGVHDAALEVLHGRGSFKIDLESFFRLMTVPPQVARTELFAPSPSTKA